MLRSSGEGSWAGEVGQLISRTRSAVGLQESLTYLVLLGEGLPHANGLYLDNSFVLALFFLQTFFFFNQGYLERIARLSVL